jgi:hypothetical protein
LRTTSAANIRTDNITVVGFDNDMSVGASLLPTTVPIAGPIHSLGSESYERKTVFAEDVKLEGTSLSSTLQGLQHSIDAVDVFGCIPQNEKTDFSMDKLTVPDLTKISVTSFQDFEGEVKLEDILEYAVGLVEYEHPITVSLVHRRSDLHQRHRRERRHDPARAGSRQLFSEDRRVDLAVARGTFC